MEAFGSKTPSSVPFISSWLEAKATAPAAQLEAARRDAAQAVLRQGLMVALALGLALGAVGAGISGSLPVWLHGAADVCPGSSRYFFIYSCALPFVLLRQTAGGMLQCSGDMKTPSALNILMCCMNVVFNAFFIFPTRVVTLLGMDLTIFGVGMGVAGAALGTVMSETVTTILMMYFVCLRSPVLKLVKGVPWRLEQNCMMTTVRLAVPIALERVTTSLAQIAGTKIVSPLGTTAVAANSLAVTAEGFCYMPGYGIGSAATTLVGQSIGAQRLDLSKRFARLSTALGMAVMSCMGVVMFLAAPWMFTLLTPDPAIRELGAYVLRIEAFAEPLFAAAIVAAGALRGAGDTLVPCVMNLVSMWGVRLTMAAFLAPLLDRLGLPSELLPLMLVRPISGSAALGVGAELIQTYGPDSLVGRTAAVMLGSTETTFYTIAVYFGAVGITKTRYAVPAALCADLTGFLAAAWAVRDAPPLPKMTVFFPARDMSARRSMYRKPSISVL